MRGNHLGLIIDFLESVQSSVGNDAERGRFIKLAAPYYYLGAVYYLCRSEGFDDDAFAGLLRETFDHFGLEINGGMDEYLAGAERHVSEFESLMMMKELGAEGFRKYLSGYDKSVSMVFASALKVAEKIFEDEAEKKPGYVERAERDVKVTRGGDGPAPEGGGGEEESKCPNCAGTDHVTHIRCACGYDFELKTVLILPASTPEEGSRKVPRVPALITIGVPLALIAALFLFRPSPDKPLREGGGGTGGRDGIAAALTDGAHDRGKAAGVGSLKNADEGSGEAVPVEAGPPAAGNVEKEQEQPALMRSSQKAPFPGTGDETKSASVMIKAEPEKIPDPVLSAKVAKHGVPPVQNPLDGSYGLVNKYLLRFSPRPESIKVQGCTEVYYTERGWLVGCNFQGINDFGRDVRNTNWFVISHGTVVVMD